MFPEDQNISENENDSEDLDNHNIEDDSLDTSGDGVFYDDEDKKHHLTGMFQTWFLDYASYVILERAVPHMQDGLKPVQRRILHSMERMDDGRYNKVANIIGHTMQFHPHGDASIGDALVQLGQKDLLIDCQGNWGNTLTGDGPAAPRYIEARLSKFALEVLFNAKTTEWRKSYDGRNNEPITLPVKYPLLLAQGAEGIAVGLSSRILPHNFNEICDASIKHLKGEKFEFYPDFPSGGYIDIERYNDGERGGSVKIRAKISKLDNRTLIITDVPYSKTSESIVDSILRANERGNIKVRKVDDITASNIEIHVHLAAGVSSDKTIDALYAFTDCEISISPNCCIIENNKPHFIAVSDILRSSAENTKRLLQLELEIERGELEEKLHFASLEKIFIEERIYKDKEFEEAKNLDIAVKHIDKRLAPFAKDFFREVIRDDILKLMDIRMGRILRFNSDKADDTLAKYKSDIKNIDKNIKSIVQYTIDWYEMLKTKYGKAFPRKTEIRSFNTIEAAKVVAATEKLYINRKEGFIGTTMRQDEFICDCSMLDDVVIFYTDGRYKIVKVEEKLFIGKDILHINLFRRNDKRTIYNVVYLNGETGVSYLKRFAITSIVRDREYNVSTEEKGSKILYFTANPNGEAEKIRVDLRARGRIRTLRLDYDFSELTVRGRDTIGNMLTKNAIRKISLSEEGESTLGGRKVWFDKDVLRLNYDKQGDYLGEFDTDDKILVVYENGDFHTTSFDLTNHFTDGLIRIEKFDTEKIWTAVLFNADQDYVYLKRFFFEETDQRQSYLGDNEKSILYILTDIVYPRIQATLGGEDSHREDIIIDAEEFIAAKTFRARGKRLTTYQVDKLTELEPTRFPEEEEEEGEEEGDMVEDKKEQTGQKSLFDEE